MFAMRGVYVAGISISALALAGCAGGGGDSGGSGGGAPSAAAPIVTAQYAFPAGDATSAPGGTAWDIIGVKTTLSGSPGSPGGNAYDTLRVDVTFVQNITNALPAPGQSLVSGNQLGVGIALDVDGNPNTGEYASCTLVGGLHPFEYFSDIGTQSNRLADGNYGIIDPSGNLVYDGGSNPAGEAVTSAIGSIFSQTFYLPSVAVFSQSTVPRIGVAVAGYDGLGVTPTDCVPKKPSVELFTR